MGDFRGKGFDFPLQLGGDGKFRIVSGSDKIKASIRAILSTPFGSRIMRREFGCRVHEINFENETRATISLARYYTKIALQRWEPRIAVDDDGIDIWMEGPDLYISVTYDEVDTNTEDNLVVQIPTGKAA